MSATPEPEAAERLLREVLAAWDAIPNSCRRTNGHVERWLTADMAPAIARIRDHVEEDERRKAATRDV